jgi:molecular chaperone HtpG
MTDTATPPPPAAGTETFGFQAEVSQLLRLMIHSLYSHREIFLRELISNASDANDKLRFLALSDPALLAGDAELRIWVDYDAGAGTLSVRDNGVGMTRDEAIAHLGTIARSGTAEFFRRLTGDQQKDSQLIGQFGVGFYSAFIVADRVEVLTRKAGEPPAAGVRWASRADGEYTLEPVERAERGTTVVLHLKDDAKEFADAWRLRTLVRRYSDHIGFPVLMRKEGEATLDWEAVNQAQALWTRPRTEVTDDEYREFYRHVARDFTDPLAWSHNRVEGRREYTSLLYVPARAPFDLFQRDAARGLKLYVRRVFIMDDAEHLSPPYLRFVRGVIDSNDLPLNVSREILQESKDVEAIRAGVVKRVLGMLDDLAQNDKAKYQTFWQAFGRVLKEGVGEDTANRERIAKLLRFATTHANSEAQEVSLDDYIGRMKHGQNVIYYVSAETFNAAKNSPHLEVFRKKGIEVLLLSDRVDEWVVSGLTEYEGKKLESVARGDLDLGALADEQDTKAKEETGELKDLLEAMKSALGERVKDVRVTNRLTESPACLVADKNDMSANLERLLKAAGQQVPGSKPILEINATHPLVQRLKEEIGKERFADWSGILFDQALLAEGGSLEDPGGFVKRLNQLMLELAGAGSRIWVPGN